MPEAVYKYRATCPRVVDGDTFVLAIDLGFRVTIEIHGRLRGVNTPEVVGAEKAAGLAAAQFVRSLLTPATPLIVESFKDEQSFARWVVDVTLPDGSDLADVLVKAGHAVVLNA